MKNKISIWLSLIALLLSIIAAFRTTPMEADWMGILVGILALLVTLLVGWQIFNIISINKQVHDKMRLVQSQTEQLEKSIISKFQEEKEDLQIAMNRKDIELFYTISMTMVNHFWKIENYQIRNGYLVLALETAIQLKNKEKVESVLGLLENSLKLKDLTDSMDKGVISDLEEDLKRAAQISPKACEIFAILLNKNAK